MTQGCKTCGGEFFHISWISEIMGSSSEGFVTGGTGTGAHPVGCAFIAHLWAAA
jgi:hypothetical protein